MTQTDTPTLEEINAETAESKATIRNLVDAIVHHNTEAKRHFNQSHHLGKELASALWEMGVNLEGPGPVHLLVGTTVYVVQPACDGKYVTVDKLGVTAI